MIKILHFADAHIDMANYGRHDAQSGLPVRMMDFLKSLDTIVDTAIEEKVDLVLFSGDAYKDRTPTPTSQREWEMRIMRLSKAGIPSLLLLGNHDISPALGRASALEAFNTLEVPLVRVLDKSQLLKPGDLWNLPLQVISLPWLTRSGYLQQLGVDTDESDGQRASLTILLNESVESWLEEAGQDLPIVLMAHCSVAGAVYGNERSVMLGSDLLFPPSLMRNPHLDYVALGHIHKHQNLNQGQHPPVIYPGSIERVDFSEAQDDKFFVIAEVDRGHTEFEWHQLTDIRPFIDRKLRLTSQEHLNKQLRDALPPQEQLEGAIVRLVLEYPRDWEAIIDDSSLRKYAAAAFEFHLVKRPQIEGRTRLPQDQTAGGMTHLELLDLYWNNSDTPTDEMEALNNLARQIIKDAELEYNGNH